MPPLWWYCQVAPSMGFRWGLVLLIRVIWAKGQRWRVAVTTPDLITYVA
jgi:hypothetical protein